MTTNWAGNVTFAEAVLHRPTAVDEVSSVVAAATAAGRRVHACGSTHSFSTVADVHPGGELISMAGLDRIVDIDDDAMTVTIEGGVRYGELSAALQACGLALQNLPSLPHITVAGAVATATHGSGQRNGNLATAVRVLELVVADGSMLRIDRDDPRFPGAVVGLGALGVVAGLTLAVEPAFDVAQTLYIDLPVDVACDELDAVMGSAYSLSLFTDYRRDVIDQVWWKGRLDTDGDPPSALFGARPATESLHPVPGVSAESCTEQLGVPGPWADRLTHFRLGFEPSSGDELQSEFFVGRADGPAAIRAVLALRDRLATVLKVSEIRTVAADDLWLSTAYGRDTVALHFTWVNDVAAVMAFLPYLEAALEPFDARPHWGKLTALPGEVVRRRSGRWDDFASLRQALDPNGTFLNPYVSALL